MIYLNSFEIANYYGKPTGGLKIGRFNSDSAGSYGDKGYKYEFGYINDRCVYVIIQKKTGSAILVEEAQGFRFLNGKGEWKLNVAFTSENNPAELQAFMDDLQRNLGYTYTPSADDQYKHPLICVHQKQRHQLVLYHPKWRPDLAQVEAKPI